MIEIRRVSWKEARTDLLNVRHAVFVVEQGVPEEIEEDEYDEVSKHLLALDGYGNAIGTARLLPSGQIGRVAVHSSMRRKGIGSALMKEMIRVWIEESQVEPQSRSELSLHAQVTSIPFYESLGFVAFGPEFEEAGIPHRMMTLTPRSAGSSS